MSNELYSDIPVRHGASITNYLRFDPIIKHAVESYPNVIQVEWQKTELTHGTFVARLRDALAALRITPQWAPWLTTDQQHAILQALEVRSADVNSPTIKMGTHSALKRTMSTKLWVNLASPVQFPIPDLTSATSATSDVPMPLCVQLACTDEQQFRQAVLSYMYLASISTNLNPLRVGADKEVIVRELATNYDVVIEVQGNVIFIK